MGGMGGGGGGGRGRGGVPCDGGDGVVVVILLPASLQ